MLLLCSPLNKKNYKKFEDKLSLEINRNNLDSLQQKGIPPFYSFCICKGEVPYITSRLTGSITLEASLIMPVIILAFMSILQLMVMMNVQLSIQHSLYEQAMKTAGYSYLANTVECYFLKDLDTDEYNEIINVAENGITELLMKQLVVSDLGEEFFQAPWIKNGKDGMYVIITPWIEEGIIDVIISYQLQTVFNVFGLDSIPMTARVRYGKWTGTTKAINTSDKEAAATDVVYITKSGAVYHTYRDCTYIKVNLTAASYSDVNNLRNESGGKYYKCNSCCTTLSQGGNVYVSRYGDKYHQSQSCSRIYHNVMEISLEEAEGKALCSKCRKRGTQNVN